LFCERVGISKVDSNIDAGDLENCIREAMDDTSMRAFAILQPLKVTITNCQGEYMCWIITYIARYSLISHI
jgi:glutaminyl-tRNA synthetase